MSSQIKEETHDALSTDFNYKFKIAYLFATFVIIEHIAGVYGFYRILYAHYLTILWNILITYCTAIGITMGGHRLFSHKTFKATFVVKLVLTVFHTMAAQGSVYYWVITHRLHHKHSDTDADPHNAKRGFFFSHVGWLLYKSHPLVDSKSKTVDMSDIEADKLLMSQKRYYALWIMIFHVLIPLAVPFYFWSESITNTVFICLFFRHVANLNAASLVNSAAHLYGNKPFERDILPSQNALVSIIAVGEGWHNYHHSFPWDYRTAEYGSKYQFTTHVIDLLAKYNLVYDLRTTPDEMIRKRAMTKGDGTYFLDESITGPEMFEKEM